MAPIETFIVMLTLCYICYSSHADSITFISIPSKSIVLTPRNNGQQGATIYSLRETNDVSSNLAINQWEITATSMNKWLLKLHLDKTWGFHPYIHSSINITINSPTVAGIGTFDKLIIGFTAPNSNKYFVISLPMANVGWPANRIMPGLCDTKTIPNTSMRIGNITNPNNKEIEQLLNNTGSYMMPNSWRTPRENNEWPITIILENYPSSTTYGGYSVIQYKSAGFLIEFMQQCGFEQFDSYQGLDVYFAIAKSELLTIKSIKIDYSDNSTLYPTHDPTNYQTNDPSIKPTIMPTQYINTAPINVPTNIPSFEGLMSSFTTTDSNDTLNTIDDIDNTLTVMIMNKNDGIYIPMEIIIIMGCCGALIIMFVVIYCVYRWRRVQQKNDETNESTDVGNTPSVKQEQYGLIGGNIQKMQSNIFSIDESVMDESMYLKRELEQIELNKENTSTITPLSHNTTIHCLSPNSSVLVPIPQNNEKQMKQDVHHHCHESINHMGCCISGEPNNMMTVTTFMHCQADNH